MNLILRKGENMRKIISLLSAMIISVVSFTGMSNAADSKKPIRIPTHNWSSQVVMAYVIGEFLKVWETMWNMYQLTLRLFMSQFE